MFIDAPGDEASVDAVIALSPIALVSAAVPEALGIVAAASDAVAEPLVSDALPDDPFMPLRWSRCVSLATGFCVSPMLSAGALDMVEVSA